MNKNMRFKRIALFGIILLAIITTAYSVFSKKPSPPPAIENKPVSVETSPVVEARFADQYETLGSLNSTDSIDISSELAGQISAIHFKPGNRVKKGQLLIQLDATIYKTELASAEGNLKLSEMNFKRTRELAKRHLASEQALDQALADLKEKENLVKVKRAQVEKLNLRAPFTGILGSRQISIGQYVNVGQPLVHLVANQQLRVEFQVPERYLGQLQRGQKVSVVSEAFPDKHYTGVVNYMGPSIDKDTRTVAVEALIDNKDHLLYSGLFVRITHQFGNEKKRLLIPEESIIPTINGQKVFVLRNHKAVAVNVITGTHHADMTEIKEGLVASDIVIVRGQHKLKDGSLVIDSKQA
ncbi:hemolysin D [Legionella israelensis]|uniref:Hemolysin D n=2 Tax=Legionella israelensis TaxID=454 RepID=A0A0W0W555_9GAMM|nr:hemolysin D [Legionella israelensis]QBS10593.1 efflux RND transporter periplasmic adaptor subunit [Legionella israelensis]SCY36447.1 membrane fusion protein, multidrug efflux system [Legionella israelensis DSM 19235]STX57537.1 hemolysin D [Legionella israelensis]